MTNNDKNLASLLTEGQRLFCQHQFTDCTRWYQNNDNDDPDEKLFEFFLNFVKDKQAEQENLCSYSFSSYILDLMQILLIIGIMIWIGVWLVLRHLKKQREKREEEARKREEEARKRAEAELALKVVVKP